ncbi:Nuclear protein localization protein 4-like protein, partial [Armadillidium vulgare]
DENIVQLFTQDIMIIRVQSEEGTKRVEVTSTETTTSLYEKVYETFELDSFDFALHKTRDKKNEIFSSGRKTIKGCKLAHGDMIYLFKLKKIQASNGNVTHSSTSSSSGNSYEPMPSTSSDIDMSIPSTSTTYPIVQQQTFTRKSSATEDEVDQILSKMDGKVERKRNPMLCRHLGNSRCIHCTPLDPWDETLLKEPNIKHLSFHAYLRKLVSGVDKGKFSSLEDISCKIKPGCKDHPPWPQGICSKCQPTAVTLNRQSFRHVDNVTFENPNIVERFINYWRVTGHQRVGLLYGKHQPHLDVPLGIKASVSAIYEPPQEGSRDYVKFLPDPKREIVDEVAKGLGLQCVGWIFTDLVPLDPSAGTVRHLRHADNYFLSSHEVITAAHFQTKYPNPCKLAPSGNFGSKFTTVIVTGDKENQVHMEGYQVSNQCQALVRDDCLIPTKDSPELAYIKESSAKQYVPDVYFKEKDQYGNDVVKLGRPLPVEYLLVDCPVSTPNEPVFTFTHSNNPFPIENRFLEGHLQDFSSLSQYFHNFKDSQFLEAVSDFHLLIFLATMDMLPLRDLSSLLEAIKKSDPV